MSANAADKHPKCDASNSALFPPNPNNNFYSFAADMNTLASKNIQSDFPNERRNPELSPSTRENDDTYIKESTIK